MQLGKVYRYENTWICPWSVSGHVVTVLLYHGTEPPTIYSWRKTNTDLSLLTDDKWKLTDCDQIPGAIDDDIPF